MSETLVDQAPCLAVTLVRSNQAQLASTSPYNVASGKR